MTPLNKSTKITKRFGSSNEYQIAIQRDKKQDISASVSGNNMFIAFRGGFYTFNIRGLIHFIRDLAAKEIKDQNAISLAISADAIVRIPAGKYVACIILTGDATGVNINFNGEDYDEIDPGNDTIELLLAARYVASETEMTITATSWGSLNIIIKII